MAKKKATEKGEPKDITKCDNRYQYKTLIIGIGNNI